MDTPQCDAIVLSAMAWMDGETAPIDRAEIDVPHSHVPPLCVGDRSASFACGELSPVSRAAVTADVWPAIEAQLDRPDAIPPSLVLTAGSVFCSPGGPLEAATMDPLAWWTRPVAVGVAALLFLCLRVNPFRFEPRLV